jgi:hypothetical protein
MRANLTDTYTYGGKFYGPGNDIEIPPEMAASLRQRGILPDGEGDDSGDVLSSLPPGAVAGYFVPGDSISSPVATRLGAGLVARPQAIVTPGDPVQRAAATAQPFTASAVERNTADPSAGLPPPVVHTLEGQAVEPDQDDEAEGEAEDGEENPEAEEGSEASETTPPPSEGTTTPAPSRPSRVTSRPRSTAATPE